MTTQMIPFMAGAAEDPFPLAVKPNQLPPETDWAADSEWAWGEGAEYLQEEYSELARYRERTVGLLRRYMRLSVETGRLPSLLGREFFRARVTAYRAATFEDAVIFVHDIECSLEQLDAFAQQLIAKIVLQEYSQWDAARQLRLGIRTVERCFPEAVDALSRIFLRAGILEPLPDMEALAEKSCQEGKTEENFASCCKQGE